MRKLKFRAWDEDEKAMVDWDNLRDTQLLNDGFDNDHCVLMQFTGFKVKKKEIYEGDIIDIFGLVGVVTWNNNAFRFNSDGAGIETWSPDHIKIIGNVYENPKLIPAKGVCDKCINQEDGRHYCLLLSKPMKNMDISTCDDFQERGRCNLKKS
jgi:hypothetical protein